LQVLLFFNLNEKLRLSNPHLVASDDLHPSESDYTLFAEHILPKAKVALQD